MKSPFVRVIAFLVFTPLLALRLMAADDPDPMAALRALKAPEHRPVAFMDEHLALSPGSTVALMGGTDMLNEQRYGYLELALREAFASRELHFRNIAWSADTVYRQQRPLYFYDRANFDQKPGSSADQRQPVEADAFILWFGKMESLEGTRGLENFQRSLRTLLDRLMKMTPRIVLLTPTPFYETGPAAALAAERNASLSQYAAVIQDLAAEKGLLSVDLSALNDSGLSWNGIHLNEKGHYAAAALVTKSLTGKAPKLDAPELASLIQRKNQLWDQYYRPTNWAFLYGDRQSVPSSRDHVDSEKRWFPHEVEIALPMIKELEARIHEISN